VRSFPTRTLALIGALLGLVLASGCDATDLTAEHPITPYPTSFGTPAVPRPTHSHSSAPTSAATQTPTQTPTHASATPSVTAVATNTGNVGSGSVSGPPASYAAAAARLAALSNAPHRSLNRFTTTGDVVYCVLKDRYIPTSCELRSGAIRDPGVCGHSMTDSVGRIQLGDGGAVPECNSDTIRQPGATVIGAPAVVTNGNLECGIERIGVTCINTHTRAGFFLTPGKYATFS
jgi:hypothetical protein